MDIAHTTFLDLNDDCIIEIFSYLSVKEVFALWGIFNPRINELVYRRVAQFKHFVCEFRNPHNFSAFELMKIGRNLLSLHLTVGYMLHPITFLSTLSCLSSTARADRGGKLQTLTIHYIIIKEPVLRILVDLCEQLVELNLSYCSLDDDQFRCLAIRLAQVKHVIVIGNYDMSGSTLTSIKNTELELLNFEAHMQPYNAISRLMDKLRKRFTKCYIRVKRACESPVEDEPPLDNLR